MQNWRVVAALDAAPDKRFARVFLAASAALALRMASLELDASAVAAHVISVELV